MKSTIRQSKNIEESDPEQNMDLVDQDPTIDHEAIRQLSTEHLTKLFSMMKTWPNEPQENIDFLEAELKNRE